MTNQEVIEAYSSKSLGEIQSLRSELYDLYCKIYNSRYKEIRIHPGEIITDKISKETGFRCYHQVPRQEYSAGRGTHVIVIPKEQYTEELAQELRNKYDDKW